MSKINLFLRKSYILIILAIFYIPVVFMVVLSFNNYNPAKRGAIDPTVWKGFSFTSYSHLFSFNRGDAIINSFILGSIVSFAVAILTLLTVYALWKQRNKSFKVVVDGTSNVVLINPDIITAISLSIVFSSMFGILSVSHDGMIRAIISHVVMILPFGILIAYPKSNKFKVSIFEASKDLGYGPLRSWFRTYFRYMMPIIIAVVVVSLTLSFDDFILTRTVSNTSTIGTKLYETKLKGWTLALGSIMMLITISSSIIYAFIKNKRGNYEK